MDRAPVWERHAHPPSSFILSRQGAAAPDGRRAPRPPQPPPPPIPSLAAATSRQLTQPPNPREATINRDARRCRPVPPTAARHRGAAQSSGGPPPRASSRGGHGRRPCRGAAAGWNGLGWGGRKGPGGRRATASLLPLAGSMGQARTRRCHRRPTSSPLSACGGGHPSGMQRGVRGAGRAGGGGKGVCVPLSGATAVLFWHTPVAAKAWEWGRGRDGAAAHTPPARRRHLTPARQPPLCRATAAAHRPPTAPPPPVVSAFRASRLPSLRCPFSLPLVGGHPHCGATLQGGLRAGDPRRRGGRPPLFLVSRSRTATGCCSTAVGGTVAAASSRSGCRWPPAVD